MKQCDTTPFQAEGDGGVDKLLRGDDGIFGTGKDKKGYKLNKMSSKRPLSKHGM